jgi:glutamyl-tRNA reductase
MASPNDPQLNNFSQYIESQKESFNQLENSGVEVGLSTERERAEQIVTAEIERAINSLPNTDKPIALVLEQGLRAADNQSISNIHSEEILESLVQEALSNPNGIYETVQKMRREGELYLLDRFHDELIKKLTEPKATSIK